MPVQVTRVGESYFVTNGLDAALEFTRLADHSSGISAEIIARVPSTGAEHWSRLNLAAPRSRADLAKDLDETCAGVSWRALLAEACQAVVTAWRHGDPPVPLVAAPPSPRRWLVPWLIPRGETTILYGDGDSLKSLLALAIAWAGLRGEPLAPFWPVAPLNRVLFLDYETSQDELATRWWGLCAGVGLTALSGVIYQSMTRPITDSLAQLSRVIAEEDIDLAIVDSLAPAAGAEPEGADASVRTMNALRTLPVTRLVVAHVSKSAADSTGPTRPYGSVFNRNLARSAIEAKADAPSREQPRRVTYHHTKSNLGPRQAPTALGWTFTPAGAINVEQSRPEDATAPIPARILSQLRAGAMTASELSAEMDIPQAQVRTSLARLHSASRVVRLGIRADGKRGEHQWGLADRERTAEA